MEKLFGKIKKKIVAPVTAAIILAVGAITAGCSVSEESIENKIASRIVKEVNASYSLNLDEKTADFRNITRDTKAKRVIVFITAEDEESPYMITMKFHTNNLKNTSNFFDLKKEVEGNFKKAKLECEATKINENILDLANKLNGNNENALISSTDGARELISGYINGISIKNPDEENGKLSFDIDMSISESLTYMSYEEDGLKKDGTPAYKLIPKTSYYDFIRKDMLEIDLTDEYRENPMKAVEDYLDAVVNKKYDVLAKFTTTCSYTLDSAEERERDESTPPALAPQDESDYEKEW